MGIYSDVYPNTFAFEEEQLKEHPVVQNNSPQQDHAVLYIGLLVPYLGLHGHADLEERPLQFSVQHVDVLLHPLKIGNMREEKK